MRQLLDRLTLREKIGQLNQRLPGWDALRVNGSRLEVTDALRREVDRFGGIGSLYGLQRADPWSGRHWGNGIPPERSAEAAALVQAYVVGHSSSGLPTLFVEEAPHGLQGLGGQVLPVNLAVGATWDDDLVAELAALVAAQLRGRGIHVALLSGLDLLRDPRWGRAEECFSEDPYLAARLAAATVTAMQGTGTRIDDTHVAVVVKHLAAQGAGIGGRNGSGAPLGWRELHEIHLPAARAAARAGVAGYMAAYNDVDGVACSANRDLLTGVLRENWCWEGIVMADCTALDRLLDAAPDHAHAGALALRAGVDVSFWDQAYVVLDEALDRGLIEMADIDRACARVLGLKQRLGLLDHQTMDDETSFGTEASTGSESRAGDDALAHRQAHRLAHQLARESIVLLSNAGVLPLAAGQRLAVVGPNADDLAAQLGDYTAPRPVPDPDSSTVRSALLELGFAVSYAAGSKLRERLPGGLDAVRAAVDAADVAVVVVGGSSRRLYESEFAENGAVAGADLGMTSGEGVDLSRVAIDPVQIEVARAAREAGRPVVGVVIGGRPHSVTEFAGFCDALIFSAFPGPTGGDALADILTGVESPSGRLPVTLPGGEGVWPVAHDERRETSRGYADASYTDNVLLGTGLSYSTFEACVLKASAEPGLRAEVHVRVRNTGGRAARFVVPLFGRRHVLGIRPRVRQVVGHAAVRLEAGAERDVVFRLGAAQLGTVSARGLLEATPGHLDVWVSGDLHPPTDAVRIEVLP
ncbi:glycoside hydrolase family 3 C-terminal domain-containing protein [Kineosporia sp. J2-2]|uniref:Glycoside hydrolase family 3 C-terminal domain-containing protein n=1 Tax=Kineosporia corallincola TaxID=2835133 RepID=A0ABS5TC20_9ACTN|nr:glycoside hydrolase family 3 N-terminal domain-containing protein [Kineosporia corallincola]MBT0768591.1 glycoside hydrolase family 3 C-terminal domain-containing protein [Kineosporia corallincola]